jgi:hypothetical protein
MRRNKDMMMVCAGLAFAAATAAEQTTPKAALLALSWCLDWYSAHYYAVSPPRDPRGPDAGERRSSHGGSWRHHVRWSPPAARSSLPPAFRYADYGFRVVLEIG